MLWNITNITYETGFDRIPNDEIPHHQSHIPAFCYLVIALKLLSSDWSQILHIVSNNLWNTRKISTDSQCNDEYPGSCGKFYAKYWKMTYIFLYIILCIFNFEVAFFAHNITRESCIKAVM